MRSLRHPSQHALNAWLTTGESARVGRHLDGCEACLAVLEEPVLQRGQQEVFLEHRPFEVIHHRAPFAKLRGVEHAGDFARVGPLFVSPWRGDGEGGLDEHDMQLMREGGGLHDLATARAIGGRAVEQETRHV